MRNKLIRIAQAKALDGFRLRLVLTDGRTIERDVEPHLRGPVFVQVRRDQDIFRKVRVETGTVVWPNGADLCPDVVIWGDAPPCEYEMRDCASDGANREG